MDAIISDRSFDGRIIHPSGLDRPWKIMVGSGLGQRQVTFRFSGRWRNGYPEYVRARW